MLSIIVAKGKNNIIGKNNRLVWDLPNDLKRFRKLTSGHVIIMGRKTFLSIGKVLPNRKHIVFSQDPDYTIKDENVEVVHSMLEIKEYIDDDNENFVIGGAMIYSLLMPYTSKMYVTEINQEFEGDSFFPKIDEEKWKVENREKGIKDDKNKLDYEYVTYVRK